ncbi:Hypothetical predicted protein [Paramuricea clavata]|uniref:Uncharacterized protein n=1 Tax=Paramuricea clavata TaxID=317549 RepID=A0A6S7KS04_PARCT|nr:Hypothetical predicted protein [Paramuricea clavata]
MSQPAHKEGGRPGKKEQEKANVEDESKLCEKPEHWTGSVDDQKELFLHILAHITGEQLLDENRRSMDPDKFQKEHRRLIRENWEKAVGCFHRILNHDWKVKPLPAEAGLDDGSIVDDHDIHSTLYKIKMLSLHPTMKQPYGDVYDFINNSVCFYVRFVDKNDDINDDDGALKLTSEEKMMTLTEEKVKKSTYGRKYEEIKKLFEGEACALGYNDDCEWFYDEDEEFAFDPNGSNKYFEDAYIAGKEEQHEMKWGYNQTARRQLIDAEQRLEDAKRELRDAWNNSNASLFLDYIDENIL